MKLKTDRTEARISGMTGMGPFAWDRDYQKMAMHPSVPGQAEHVEDSIEQHEHRTVHRRHPEDERDDGSIVAINLTVRSWIRVLKGKRKFAATERHPDDGETSERR